MVTKKMRVAALLTACIMAITACGQTESGKSSEASKTSESKVETSSSTVVEEESYFNETGMPIVKEEITLKVLTCANPSSTIDYEDMPAWKYLSELTGIKFEFESYIEADLYQKMPLIMSDPEALPDIFWGCGMSASDLLTYGAQGLLMDMTDLIEQYGTNIKASWEKAPANKSFFTSPDGGVYGLPALGMSGVPTGIFTFQVDKRWMENCGIAEYPTTVDEFKEMLIAFRDMDANGNGDPDDEIPLMYSDALYQILGGAYDMAIDWPWTGARYSAKYGTTEALPLFMTENYRAMIEFVCELYEEKLINQDMFSVSGDENKARRLSGIYGVYSNMTAAAVDGMWDPDEFVSIPLMGSEYLEDPTAYLYTTPSYQTGMAMIGGNTEYPEACMRVLDYFFTTNGMALINASYHKGSYDLEAAGVAQEIIDIYKEALAANENDNTKTRAAVIGTLGCYESAIMLPYKLETEYANNIQKTYAELKESYVGKEFYNPTHTLAMTEEEQEAASIYETDIDSYVKERVSRWIAGEEELNDTTWNAYIQQLKDMKVDKLTEAYVSAHNRFFGVK